jgi:Tfp pilus assembly protein PilF
MSDTARYAEAEAMHREVLATRQKEAGANSLLVSTSLTNLGSVKMRQGEYVEAEELLAKAWEIRDKDLPADHPDRLSALNNQAPLSF